MSASRTDTGGAKESPEKEPKVSKKVLKRRLEVAESVSYSLLYCTATRVHMVYIGPLARTPTGERSEEEEQRSRGG